EVRGGGRSGQSGLMRGGPEQGIRDGHPDDGGDVSRRRARDVGQRLGPRHRRSYSTRTPSLSGVVPGCGVWSTKSSANSSSNTRQLPLPCTSSVFRRTTAIAASPTVEFLALAAS